MNKDLFVKSHWTQVMVLGVVVILVVSWQVVLEDTHLIHKKNQGVVKGETIKNEQASLIDLKNENMLSYQTSIKNIMTDYFEQRAKFDNPHQAWLLLINKTKYKILSLGVPEEYNELQVRIITTLDLEYQLISGLTNMTIDQINQRWQEILKQYFWLNQ